MTDDVYKIIHSGEFRPVDFARLTSQLNIYHQIPNEDSRQFQYASEAKMTDSENSPFQRTVSLQNEWTELDIGWFGGEGGAPIGQIILFNRTGMKYQTRPTPEQLEEDAQAIIEVQVRGILVRPKHFAVYSPIDNSPVVVRSLAGAARLEYVVIPR